MLTSRNQTHVIHSKQEAPARLARADVATIRRLYEEAWCTSPRARGEWKQSVSILFERNRRVRTAARLGRLYPHCRVEARWSIPTSGKAWGLNVTVTGVSVFRDSDGSAWRSMEIGSHRFRAATSQAQFCREVSHLVRLGLGWVRRFSN
jgi:hypothetical protein